jgi:hypothetical protein
MTGTLIKTGDMMTYADRLLGWFDRSREEDSGIPAFVTREDARNARLYLQDHSGFDFARFEEGIQVEKLLSRPLGETAECLSADDIAELVGSDVAEASMVFDSGLAARAIRHSQNCDACFDNIALYQELKNRSIERAIDNKVEDLAPALSIGSVGRLEAAANGARLGLAVTMYCDASDFNGMGIMQAQILGPFDAKDVTLHRVEPRRKKRWFGASVRKSPARLFQGYYRTDSLTELDQVRDDVCGFISISQDIGGREVHSRRVIRLQRDSALLHAASKLG